MTLRQATLIAALLLAPGATHPALDAQAPDLQAELKDLDKKIQEASVSGEVDLLERHLADDFAFTHFGGGRDDKAHWVRLAKLTPRPYLRRAVSEQLVELHGDVALVLGRLDVRTRPRPAQSGAAPPPDARPSCYALRYIHAYARRGERWLFLSHHTTAMLEDAHPCT